jgi:hypothetical protein
MAKKIGLVAFFDILGYQNFLVNNEPKIAAEKISEFIKHLKDFRSETFVNIFKKKNRAWIKPLLKKFVYLIISDAILLTLEADRANKDYVDYQKVFLIYCSRLLKQLFVYGLPLRGAIEYGEYILIENRMFAGHPIVKAYQAAMDLDLSACQISDSVDVSLPKLHKRLYIDYITPLRTGEEKPLKLLMPFNLRDNEDDQFTLKKITDLEQFIINSFCAHNKTINKNVRNKILNTGFFLRYCKTFL